VVSFTSIDKVIERLEREEVKTEAILDSASAQAYTTNKLVRTKLFKLKRLR